MRKNFLSSNGFTLIELIIVISIILLFTGFSLVYYNVFTQERTLNNEVDKMISVLELAKKSATTASGLSTSCSGLQFMGYAVTLNYQANSQKYAVSNCCGNLSTCFVNNSYTIRSSVNLLNPPSSIFFNALYGTTSNVTPLIFRLGINPGAKCYTVTISDTGLINKSNIGTISGSSCNIPP